MKYPECEKMQGVKDKSQAIGEFLEWLNYEKHIILATAGDEENSGDLSMIHYSSEELLAEFFEIDLKKVEKEKQQILKEIRQ